MPGPAQAETFGGQPRLHGPHPRGELAPGKDAVQADEQVIVQGDVLPEGGSLRRQLRQNAIDLLLLLGLELPELVVGLHHPHGLDEKGRARPGQVVDQAGDLVLKLRLHRHHIPAGPLGDDALLEVLGLGGGDDLLQNIPDLTLRGPDMPADGGQLRAGRVRQLPVPYNGAGDLVLQKPVGVQGMEEDVNGAFLLPVALPVLLGRPGGGQHPGDVQQLPGVQASPHVRPLEGAGHRLDPGKRGTAPQHHFIYCRRGLFQTQGHLRRVGFRPQPAGPLLALLRDRLVSQQAEHPGQLQGFHGFFKQICHGLAPSLLSRLGRLGGARCRPSPAPPWCQVPR